MSIVSGAPAPPDWHVATAPALVVGPAVGGVVVVVLCWGLLLDLGHREAKWSLLNRSRVSALEAGDRVCTTPAAAPPTKGDGDEVASGDDAAPVVAEKENGWLLALALPTGLLEGLARVAEEEGEEAVVMVVDEGEQEVVRRPEVNWGVEQASGGEFGVEHGELEQQLRSVGWSWWWG